MPYIAKGLSYMENIPQGGCNQGFGQNALVLAKFHWRMWVKKKDIPSLFPLLEILMGCLTPPIVPDRSDDGNHWETFFCDG